MIASILTILIFFPPASASDSTGTRVIEMFPKWVAIWSQCEEFDLSNFNKSDFNHRTDVCSPLSTRDSLRMSLFASYSPDSTVLIDAYANQFFPKESGKDIFVKVRPGPSIRITNVKTGSCYAVPLSENITIDDFGWTNTHTAIIIGHSNISRGLSRPFYLVFDSVTDRILLADGAICKIEAPEYFKIRFPNYRFI